MSAASIHVVLSWDRQATLQVSPEIFVHELLLRAQDALQHGISSLTTASGQLLAGLVYWGAKYIRCALFLYGFYEVLWWFWRPRIKILEKPPTSEQISLKKGCCQWQEESFGVRLVVLFMQIFPHVATKNILKPCEVGKLWRKWV